MPLKPSDKEQIRQAVKQHVEPKVQDIVCMVCKTRQWVMTDTVFEIREFFGGGMKIGAGTQILPVVAVTCQTCGYVLLFNAVHIGAVES